jgi:threonine dehydratase
MEIAEDLPDVGAVLVPIGGGGLIAGMAMAIREVRPGVRLIGVEPAGSANMLASRQQGKAVDLTAVTTIADGLATKKTDPEVFGIINSLVDELVAVTDEDIVLAIPFLLERTKLLAEPAGAATVAALLAGKVSVPFGTKTVALVSGGNFDVSGRMTLRY